MQLNSPQPLLVRHRFALASISIPLLIRLIPEIIAGPYPIGYDTITAYVPAMRDWAAGNTAAQFDPAVGGWLIFVEDVRLGLIKISVPGSSGFYVLCLTENLMGFDQKLVRLGVDASDLSCLETRGFPAGVRLVVCPDVACCGGSPSGWSSSLFDHLVARSNHKEKLLETRNCGFTRNSLVRGLSSRLLHARNNNSCE